MSKRIELIELIEVELDICLICKKKFEVEDTLIGLVGGIFGFLGEYVHEKCAKNILMEEEINE